MQKRFISDEEIVRMFVEDKRPMREIPAHNHRVRRVLDAAGVERQTKTMNPDAEKIIAMDEEGYSTAAIARTLGVATNTVRKYRNPQCREQAYGIDLKPAKVPWEPAQMPVLQWEVNHKGYFGDPDAPTLIPEYRGPSRTKRKRNEQIRREAGQL